MHLHLQRVVLEMTRSTRTQMDDQRKDHIDLKRPKHKKQSKQLQTYNLPINDVENFNSTIKGWDLLLANKSQIVPLGAERMSQKIQRHRRITLHRSTHPKWEEEQTEKSSSSL